MLTSAFSFALMSEFAHALGKSCDWSWVALARAGLGLVFAIILARHAGVRLVLWRPRSLWMRSSAGTFSLLCSFYALTHLPTADALTVLNMFPIWLAILSWPMLGQAPTVGSWLSVACAVVGVALIQQPHFAEGNFASFVALLGSVSTSFALMGLHLLRHVDPRAIVAHFSALATVVVFVVLIAGGQAILEPPIMDPPSLALFLGIGVAATVGQILMTKAFATAPPAKVATVGLSQVVFAMLMDTWAWTREWNALTLVGIALVLAPTAWTLWQSASARTPVGGAADDGHL
jgi:drug/metabolite transporter (DMT)-like permease